MNHILLEMKTFKVEGRETPELIEKKKKPVGLLPIAGKPM